MQIPADRFNNDLEWSEDDKADFKIKAKQFVKVYGQMASIMLYEVEPWEYLFWFLKFLIPHMKVRVKEKKVLDDILESVDLNTYGLERTKLNVSIGLDESNTDVEPLNPTVRGAHGQDEDKDALEEIIKTFNERWFHGWDATPEEQRVRMESFFDRLEKTDGYDEKIATNNDKGNMKLALNEAMKDAMNKNRKIDMEFYKLFVKDESFRAALMDTFIRTRINPGAQP